MAREIAFKLNKKGQSLAYEYSRREVRTPERFSENQYWPGDWADWGFFLFRPYKKGTVHFEFKDREVWAALNARYARIKGQVLPEKQRKPRTTRRQAQGVAA